MSYEPSNQYRCTIVRGRNQNVMEDMLPIYAEIVHQLCPCEKEDFVKGARKRLSKVLFGVDAYEKLPFSNQKTVNNHLTETAGTLLCLYYYSYDEGSCKEYAYESASCKFVVDKSDNPAFFKNLCLNMQFPNAAKKKVGVLRDLENKLGIRQLCFVVSLVYYAQKQPEKELLTKQEIGYYVLNNLDVLQGQVRPEEVYCRIMQDRKNGIRRPRMRGEHEWQHIQEQINLLELANIIEQDSQHLWLNKDEAAAIQVFLDYQKKELFDIYAYTIDTPKQFNELVSEWRKHYSSVNKEIELLHTHFPTSIFIDDYDNLQAHRGAISSSVDLGDDGEALVYQLEKERVRQYKERLVNKVLLLGKTKGLGYDISSLEADENPDKPEFARYIEVKSTKRVTEPSFDNDWMDSINITAKEWVAAEQYREYYNIYRVYFTKMKTIIVRINNPFKKYQDKGLEVYPTIYQMNFGTNVIEKRYEGE